MLTTRIRNLLVDLLDTARHLERESLHLSLDVLAPAFGPQHITPLGDIKTIAEVNRPRPMGEVAAERAMVLWRSGIYEPPGCNAHEIDAMIRSSMGLTWPTADAIKWRTDAAYTKNGMFAWCGAFAAFCYGAAGLLEEIRRKHMASTVRLYDYWAGTDRYAEDHQGVEPGDLVVVGDPNGKRFGTHICVAVAGYDGGAVRSGVVHTVEGNARGVMPDGGIAEGVVRRSRPLSKKHGGPGFGGTCAESGLGQWAEVMHVYRPTEDDRVASV